MAQKVYKPSCRIHAAQVTSMPKTKQGRKPRTGVRLPDTMLEWIDQLVKEHPEMNYNRQQFVESAIREKIERTRLLERPRCP